MRVNLTIILLACIASLSGQNVKVTKHYEITPSVGQSAFYPILSPDGNRIVYTSENFSGLKSYDFASGKNQIITTAEGAGFDPIFSTDGSTVYYRPQSIINGRVHRSLKEYNLIEKAEKQLIAPTRDLKRPVAISGGMEVVADNKLMKSTGSQISGNYVYSIIKEGKIIVCDGKNTRILRPYGDKVDSYLWTAVSPDGSKIVTYAIGVGTVVLDMQGNILAELGDYESPTWYGNDFVAAMKATDDGHQFTSSKIVLLDCNSKQVHDLTSPSEMGMNPSASAEAGRIVYSTVEGKLFMLELNVTK